MKKTLFALFIASSLFGAHYKYEVSPMLGYNIAEGNINLDNYMVFGAEMQFNDLLLPIFKPEVSLFYGKSQYNEPAELDGKESNIFRIAVNGVHEYRPLYDGIVIPYAKAGIGYEVLDKYSSKNRNSVYADIAGGVKLLLTKKWAFKAEALYMLKDNSTRLDNNFDLLAGVTYSFGVAGQKRYVAQNGESEEQVQATATATTTASNEDLFADDDNDGVLNSKDKCPNTPKGVKIQPNGCEIDTDADGVPDSKDMCKSTPTGAKVDAKGCEVDSDKDGLVDSKDQCPYSDPNTKINPQTGCEYDDDNDTVPNSKDQCPKTVAGAKVDINGCEFDDDHDGVVNSADKCPATPEGAKVDAKGCELDSDGDGLVDSKDLCPNTPKGLKVDENGCPQAQNLQINFKPNSYDVDAASKANIERFARFLKAAPMYRVKIVGYSDSIGSAKKNKKLSLKRAQSVKQMLVDLGVDPSRITAEGKGEANPIASNKTKEGRAKNRRIEAELIK